MSERLLEGVRVVELATEIAGPYGGKLLADLGAEVFKVEPPDGDPLRRRGPFPGNVPNPEWSALFSYLNAAKLGIGADVTQPADRQHVLDLCSRADIVIEGFGGSAPKDSATSVAELRASNPRLVVVSVTPFGRTGPRAGWRGNDLIAFHSSGMAYGFPASQVDAPDLPPLNAPSYAALFLAGEMVAGAALHGLNGVQQAGRGCHLDLSLQEAVAAENQSQFSAYERSGRVGRTFSTEPSNPTVALLPCRDGWIAISPREEHQWTRWLAVMGDPDWGAERRFADRRARERNWADLYPLLATWSEGRLKADIFQAAQAARVACYPLSEATDLLSSPQLQARGFFVPTRDPGLGDLVVPGVPYQLDGATVAPAMRVPSPGERVKEMPGKQQRASSGSEGRVPEPSSAALRSTTHNPTADSQLPAAAPAAIQPLAGIRIVDFSWVLTGPICTKYLAALGAEVIKIESLARPDLSQRDAGWEELNPSKLSVTLNMQHEAARQLARQLIAKSDIVIENFSTGVMERLGLDYPSLKALNPHIIMASSSALGRTGPERERIAYGTLIQCFTGWAGLSAHPGLPPRSSAGIWTDPLTATMETFLLLAAIWRQRESGAGCFIDLSMAETTIAALPEPLLAWTLNGNVVRSRGNRDPLYAPQGCYPAAGEDRWVAISVAGDREWAALCRAIGRRDFLADQRLSSASGRRAQHDMLDAAISSWTRELSAADAAEVLQSAGVAATPTLTVADVLSDEHLASRSFIGEVEGLDGGTRRTLGFPWLIDGQRPDRFRRPPRVGEDNERILKGLLQLDDSEYARLVADQVIY